MPRTIRAAALLATTVLILVACGPGAGASSAPSTEAYTVKAVEDPDLGAYLTDGYGHTLYIFKNDSADTSSCTAACAGSWPSFILEAGASVEGGTGVRGTFGTITRDDGTRQITYDHQPLYYYSGDAAAGDTNGQGVSGVWFVAPVADSGSEASPMPTSTYDRYDY